MPAAPGIGAYRFYDAPVSQTSSAAEIPAACGEATGLHSARMVLRKDGDRIVLRHPPVGRTEQWTSHRPPDPSAR